MSLPLNHAGYVVEEFKRHDEDTKCSWKAITIPNEDEEVVRKNVLSHQQAEPNKMFRFYGAVTTKVKKAGL